MGSPLGPLLANVIMTELEEVLIKKLVQNGKIKFYMRYVDDTLLLVKKNDISLIMDALNKFDPNLNFTVDAFDTGTVHFLDLLIEDNTTDIYNKPTNIRIS